MQQEGRARPVSQQEAQTDWGPQKKPAEVPAAFELQVCLPPQKRAVSKLDLFPKGRLPLIRFLHSLLVLPRTTSSPPF